MTEIQYPLWQLLMLTADTDKSIELSFLSLIITYPSVQVARQN